MREGIPTKNLQGGLVIFWTITQVKSGPGYNNNFVAHQDKTLKSMMLNPNPNPTGQYVRPQAKTLMLLDLV